VFRGSLIWITLGLAVVGVACALLTAARLSFSYTAWHLTPYVIVVILSIIFPRWGSAWLGAAALMCLTDAWVFAETTLGMKSPLLMSAGLLATLKLPVVLPLGAALGALVGRLAART